MFFLFFFLNLKQKFVICLFSLFFHLYGIRVAFGRFAVFVGSKLSVRLLLLNNETRKACALWITFFAFLRCVHYARSKNGSWKFNRWLVVRRRRKTFFLLLSFVFMYTGCCMFGCAVCICSKYSYPLLVYFSVFYAYGRWVYECVEALKHRLGVCTVLYRYPFIFTVKAQLWSVTVYISYSVIWTYIFLFRWKISASVVYIFSLLLGW